ncbi:hypothetical protein L0F51_04065 [Afifella sp. H1R]|uniref:hypothetical protein n=1 Tax=Afifella sp. H1R TaxID=2908841 RepID=UPI001F37757A|nr:hypothetical protein [Afifella sp. H1R]MCF1502940.1 hypothetical protein [Afifella sp. H1R]
MSPAASKKSTWAYRPPDGQSSREILTDEAARAELLAGARQAPHEILLTRHFARGEDGAPGRWRLLAALPGTQTAVALTPQEARDLANKIDGPKRAKADAERRPMGTPLRAHRQLAATLMRIGHEMAEDNQRIAEAAKAEAGAAGKRHPSPTSLRSATSPRNEKQGRGEEGKGRSGVGEAAEREGDL